LAKDETLDFVLRRYEREASFYDRLYNPTDDLKLYEWFARGLDGPILECACGTGRVTIPLARAGHDVTGVDVSGAMLRVAKSKLRRQPEWVRKRVTLVKADIRTMRLGTKFDACMVAFFALQHLLTEDDFSRALSRMREHLKPGGRLMFVVFNPDLTRPEAVQRLDKVIEFKHGIAMRYSTQWFDRPSRITYGWHVYDFVGPTGSVRRLVSPFKLKYHFRADVERLLKGSGFEVTGVFGGYDRVRFTRGSPVMVFIARARRNQ
jgi:SAM-dependent methyltransferase